MPGARWQVPGARCQVPGDLGSVPLLLWQGRNSGTSLPARSLRHLQAGQGVAGVGKGFFRQGWWGVEGSRVWNVGLEGVQLASWALVWNSVRGVECGVR